MIVNKYANGGGGSTSGVTPQDVQQQINSALAPYWESGETKDYVDGAVSGISLEGYATSGDMQSAFTLISETQQVAAAGLNQLEGRIDELSGNTPDMSTYYTSAQTQDAISAATSGKADAANLSSWNNGSTIFPKWNKDGIITGEVSQAFVSTRFKINGNKREVIFGRQSDSQTNIEIYAPTTSGNPGEILVSTGNGAPVWSAVTMPDMSEYTPTSGFSTINGSAITNGGNIVIEGGADMSAYYTSAQTEDAISAATSGKADKANVLPNYGALKFPAWNADGIIGGEVSTVHASSNFYLNGTKREPIFSRLVDAETRIDIYAPQSAGNAGDILVSTGNGAPVWSAVTMPDMAAYTPTSGFSTINGSAITNGGNIVIEGGADMSAYYTSAQTEDAITSKNYITSAQVETQIVSKNYITSAEIADFVTSAQVETQIEAKNYVNSGDVKSQVEAYNYATVSQIPTVPTSNTAFTNDAGYITDAAIENLVTSAQVETQITSKGYATVSQIPTVPTSNTAFTNDAGYVTSAQVETQIVEKNYITSAAIANMVTSTYVSTIWRGTQSDYDAIVDKDPNTFYIIVSN